SGELPMRQRRRLVARLLALQPSSVRPFLDAGSTGGLPAGIHAHPGPDGTEYVLELRDEARTVPRLLWQDARGLLSPLRAALLPGEDVLDAAPDRVLTR